MGNIVLPTVIQGPAWIKTGGVAIYTEDKVEVDEVVESWTPKTTFGDAGPRHKSRVFKISTTPVGMLTAALLDYFYAAHIAPATYVGASIFPASNYSLVIESIAEGKNYTYERAGIGKPPSLFCGPSKTAFGSMDFLAIGAPATQPTSTTFIKGAQGTIDTDTSYNPSKVVTDIFSGALAALASPYNALGAMDGFMINFGYKTKNIVASDLGVADIILDADGFNIGCDFAPSDLTEAQADTLVGYQGANAVLPGQAYAGSAEAGNLVLTGINSGAAFTMGPFGAKSCKRIYQIGEHRFPKGALSLVNQMAFTTGAPTSLFSFTGIS